jgi:hypothetical protein
MFILAAVPVELGTQITGVGNTQEAKPEHVTQSCKRISCGGDVPKSNYCGIFSGTCEKWAVSPNMIVSLFTRSYKEKENNFFNYTGDLVK